MEANKLPHTHNIEGSYTVCFVPYDFLENHRKNQQLLDTLFCSFALSIIQSMSESKLKPDEDLQKYLVYNNSLPKNRCKY